MKSPDKSLGNFEVIEFGFYRIRTAEHSLGKIPTRQAVIAGDFLLRVKLAALGRGLRMGMVTRCCDVAVIHMAAVVSQVRYAPLDCQHSNQQAASDQ